MRFLLRLYHIIILVFLFVNTLMGQKMPDMLPYNPFQPGEELTYLLHYGFINGGKASITVDETYYRGQKVYHATASGWTTGVADRMFKVKDIYQSFFDPRTGMPLKAIRDINEGKYKYYNEVIYNRAESVVYSKRKGTIKVSPDIMDIVSAFFYLRRLNMSQVKKGDIITINTYFGDEEYPFIVRYRGKEVIKCKAAGKISCHKFAPVTEVGRVFETEDDMLFWLSDDRNMIPVRVSFDMWVGSIKCELIDYSNIKYSLNKKD